MSNYFIEFSDCSPTTVEVRLTDNLSLENIDIPSEAMKFCFWEVKDGEVPSHVGPTYYVTETLDIGSLKFLKKRYPSAHLVDSNSRTELFAYVSWSHPAGEEWSDCEIIPLHDGVALVERQTGRQIWPGIRLDQVTSLELDGIYYTPSEVCEALEAYEKTKWPYRVHLIGVDGFIGDQPARNLETDQISIPGDVTSFLFRDTSGERLSITYLISDRAEVAYLEDMMKSFPDAEVIAPHLKPYVKYGSVVFSHPTDGSKSYTKLHPLGGFIGLVDRKTGRQIWPEKEI